MIWYLLYPFRGTTEPPILSQNHPLRVAFWRHGTSSGRHWLAYILFSVALAVLVCYPVSFLYEDPSTGFSKLPYHVWTSARRYHGNQSVVADVEVRQIWIHGSYMKALQHDILSNALDLQNDLIASGSLSKEEYVPTLVTKRCQLLDGDHPDRGIHSPLMYWNCSAEVINNDTDLLHTINSQAMRLSYLNLTLRPSSVLAGKAYSEKQIKAADALVITLFDRTVSITSTWENRLARLTSHHSDKWAFYPAASGKVPSSQLYQFQYRPISVRDDIFLLVAYGLMFLYVILALKKTKAVKSQLGLIIAIITEMLVSVFASFTICGFLGIDLAAIPQEVYPFVVLVIGLENMFRLINAVLEYPPQMAPTLRIANALGDVGHLALAASTQNLFFLYLLQKVVSPDVQSFCIFAAVALVFDFFFHLMFFVAVLHVEVRRMELQDSIYRTELHSKLKQHARMQRQYWFDAFLQGRTPVITRIAGSAVSLCFILLLNFHFSDSDSVGRSLIRFLMSPMLPANNNHDNSTMFSSSPINSARTPQTWLRLQDHQSAKEVIQYVKPQAHMLIARIYEPLVLVLKGSDRSHIPLQESILLKFWKVAQHHVYTFFLVLISVVAVVTLLMQYLLWKEIPDDPTDSIPVAGLSIKRIAGGYHSLDIYKVFTNARGQILVLDLDRNMIVYTLNEVKQVYYPTIVQDHNGNRPTWTNEAVQIDEQGKWLMVWTPKGLIELWNLEDMISVCKFQAFKHPLLVDFVYAESHSNPQIVAMSVNGLIYRWSVTGCKQGMTKIPSWSDFKFAELVLVEGVYQILAIDADGEIHLAPLTLTPKTSSDNSEVSELSVRLLHDTDLRLVSIKKMDRARRAMYIPALSLLVVQRLEHVDLVHFETNLLIHRISIPKRNSPVSHLRLIHTQPRPCRLCQTPSVAALSIAYTSNSRDSCIVETFKRDNTDKGSETACLICLRPTGELGMETCKGLSTARSHTETIENHKGSWDVTNSQVIIGIRRKQSSSVDSHSQISQASGISSSKVATSMSLRSRLSDKKNPDDKLVWEIWSLDTVTGDLTAEPLTSELEPHMGFYSQDLLVTESGPVVSVGKRTVILAMGVALRTVTAGSDHVELQDIEEQKRPSNVKRLGSGSLESRRRKGTARKAL